MRCPSCGNYNQDGSPRCVCCGSPLPPPGYDMNGYPVQPPKKRSYTWLYVLVIFTLVVAIGTCTFVLFDVINHKAEEDAEMITTGYTPAAPAAPSAEKRSGDSAVAPDAPGEEKTTVPDVVGLKSADAYTKLADSGLNFDIDYAYSENVAKDHVIAQTPKKGSTVTPGDTVKLTVSDGKKPNNTSDSKKDSEAEVYSDPTDRYDLQASYRYLSQSDISWMTLGQVQHAINEIYAKNGFRFTKGDAKSYFESMDWYHPDTTNMKTVVDRMNDYEYANVRLMGKYRDSLKNP